MRLSEIIRSYRNENSLSMKLFSEKCGISLPYVSKLENEIITQKDGSKVTPSLNILSKIAHGMGMETDELIEMCDDLKQYSSKNSGLNTPPPSFVQFILSFGIFRYIAIHSYQISSSKSQTICTESG